MLAEKPWPPERVLQLFIRLLASMFIGMVLVNWINSTHLLGTGTMEFATLFVGTLSFHGVALVLTHLLLRAQGMSWREAFGFWAPRLGRAMLLALLVAAAVVPIAWTLGQLSARMMSMFHVAPVVQGPVQVLETTGSVPLKLAIGLLAIVVAPFAEEVVFRGLLYPTLKQHGLPNLALWGTSILFAAIHSNLMILIPLTFLAVVLTLLYESTGNLLAPILAHSLFNFFNFFLVVVQPVSGSKLLH